MAQHNKTGSLGEQLAVEKLIQEGFSIIETNWRCHPLEIDIIAEKNSELHIVEVKTRSSSEYGNPEQFVSKSKQKRLIKAADEYIVQNNLDVDVYFDIISVVLSKESREIYFIEDAFTPSW